MTIQMAENEQSVEIAALSENGEETITIMDDTVGIEIIPLPVRQ